MQNSCTVAIKADAKSKLELGRALQVENQLLREKLTQLGHSPTDLQGLTAQKSPRWVLASRGQAIQQARALLSSKYSDCAAHQAVSESRLRDLLRSKLELRRCRDEVQKLESEGDALRRQLLEASDAIRKADSEALAWRQARREILQHGNVGESTALKLAQDSLLQRREQLRILRLEVRGEQLSPAIQRMKHMMRGNDTLLRDVLHRWCHVVLWSQRRPSDRRAEGEQADTLDAAHPLATLELVPQSFTGEGSLEVAVVARVEQQVHRTESQRLRGKATWLDAPFKFEAFSWNSTLELEVLSVGSGDPDTLGSTSVDFLALTPGKWHVLKERIWGTTCGRLELWAFVTISPSSPPEVLTADTMPQPTQRELQKMHLQELVGEEDEDVGSASKPASREGKSQRELQRKELESLLESPSGEKQKEAKMKSLEAKIAEMQAELEAMRSAGTSARQKRDQKRMERHGNTAMAGIDKFRSAGKRLAEPASKAEIETTGTTAFGFRFEDLFKLGQEVIDEGTSEEYNIYGESDTEEKFAKRREEAQKIIAQEKERMEGGLLGRMRKGITAGGARERAARRKGKKGEAKDASPAPKPAPAAPAAPSGSAAPRHPSVSPRTTPAQPVSVFGFNFELPELLAFGQDGDDAASEVHNVYGSDTEELQSQRAEEARHIMSQEKERLEGMARGRIRQGLVTAGGARERMAKRKDKKLGNVIAEATQAAQKEQAG